MGWYWHLECPEYAAYCHGFHKTPEIAKAEAATALHPDLMKKAETEILAVLTSREVN